MLACATEISEQTDDMVRNEGMDVTSTIRCDTYMINDRSFISQTSHSVTSNLEYSVESEALCQSQFLTETT